MKRIKLLCLGLLSILIIVSLSKCDSDLFDQDPVDLTSPSIIIQSPTIEPGYSTILADLSFAGIAEDNELLKSVQWNINNGPKYDANGTNNWSTGNISIQAGDNIFVAFAGDEAGNLSTDTLIITKNKYLTFLGEPLLNPLGVFANQPTSVNISIKIASNDNLIRNSVELIQVDADNNEIATICPLYDNGNLSNGDEISGDNVFSAISVFTLSSSIRLRVKAKSTETEGIVDGVSATIVFNVFQPLDLASKSEVTNTLDNTFAKLNEVIKSNDYQATLNKTVDWLETLPGVKSASLTNGGINILFTSGLSGGIFISKVDPDGDMTQGGQYAQEIRKPTAKIPLSLQTRGDYKLMPDPGTAPKGSDDLILDKDVFIYEPFEAIFDPNDKGDNIKNELEKSSFDFNIVHLKNQDCTIKALENLTDYGFVYIDSHGASGSTWFLTGQIVSPDDDYDLLLREGKIKEFQSIDYKDNAFSKVKGTATIYGVSEKFIKSLEGKFPNSIVFGSFCYSAETNLLSDAFISKGAKTYIGFDESVWSNFAKTTSVAFATNIVKENYTSGKAFDELSVTRDPKSPNANIVLKGSKAMYFSNSLINGDFEYGDLTGWTREGDGRVIVQLGSEEPYQGNYMGIISTGLGYTTNSGQISQSFKVNSGFTKIKMNWNFLSEEFMEWVGSQFQDFLIVKIKEDANETVVFSKRIDTFASEYSLIPVSPGIVFDVGGVYMTGWKELSINISSYQNKNITLIIEVGDVGDSIFDSALLIDNITLE